MYKDLLLNRDNIEMVLSQYVESNYTNGVIKKEEKSANFSRFNINSDEINYFIDFYFNQKGGTTIQINNGKEKDEKEKLAKFISNHKDCIMASKNENNRSILFKNINETDYKLVCDEVKENKDICINILNVRDEENEHIIKLEGKWSDRVTITYNRNTENVRIQGRPLILFNEISSFFNELISIDDIAEVLSESYNEDIGQDDIENQYKRILPNSYDKHTEKLKKSLLKAVFNLNLNSSEITCTELTFEVLRALEGHIKLTLFHEYSITSPNDYGTLAMFKWDKRNLSAVMREPEKSKVGCANKITYYEKAYKHVVVYRHKIFHWDYPDSLGVDETIQMDDIDDAKTLIIDTLRLIDEYYQI